MEAVAGEDEQEEKSRPVSEGAPTEDGDQEDESEEEDDEEDEEDEEDDDDDEEEEEEEGEDEDEEEEEDDEEAEQDREEQLRVQLQALHKRLATVRRAAAVPGSNRQAADAMQQDWDGEVVPTLIEKDKKLIVCAARKPVVIEKSKHGDAWEYRESQSGFKASMDCIAQNNNVKWVAWPGACVEPGSQEGVRKRLENDYQCSPVFMNREIMTSFETFCVEILWPIFHGIPNQSGPWFSPASFKLLEDFIKDFDAYSYFNQLYLDKVAELYEDGDMVLVYDYELLLLPAFLRKRFPDLTCGFFLHCPFPTSEFYRMLPRRDQFLQGMLGADLIAFNHFEYVRHFLHTCTRILGLESLPSTIEYNGRIITISIAPTGIDSNKFQPNDIEASSGTSGPNTPTAIAEASPVSKAEILEGAVDQSTLQKEKENDDKTKAEAAREHSSEGGALKGEAVAQRAGAVEGGAADGKTEAAGAAGAPPEPSAQSTPSTPPAPPAQSMPPATTSSASLEKPHEPPTSQPTTEQASSSAASSSVDGASSPPTEPGGAEADATAVQGAAAITEDGRSSQVHATIVDPAGTSKVGGQQEAAGGITAEERKVGELGDPGLAAQATAVEAVSTWDPNSDGDRRTGTASSSSAESENGKPVATEAAEQQVAEPVPIELVVEPARQVGFDSMEVDEIVRRLQQRFIRNGKKLIVSLDQLDWSKGIPEKLHAMEKLLEEYPNWRGVVTLFLAVRDRDGPSDKNLRKIVDGLVGRVNGHYGKTDYTPIHYVRHNLSQDEVVALYSVADVALVTSLREGLSLIPLEFIAAQATQAELNMSDRHRNPTLASGARSEATGGASTGGNGQDGRPAGRRGKGVLVCSEFAGYAHSLQGGMTINPHDIPKVALALNNALRSPPGMARTRFLHLLRHVQTSYYSADRWATRIVTALKDARATSQTGHPSNSSITPLDVGYLRSFYERSSRRLLVLDCDGTLMDYKPLPQLSTPSSKVLDSLTDLCKDPFNTVYVVTGRKKEVVEDWFGHILGLGLIAEYGYWVRRAQPPQASDAITTSTSPSCSVPPSSLPSSSDLNYSGGSGGDRSETPVERIERTASGSSMDGGLEPRSPRSPRSPKAEDGAASWATWTRSASGTSLQDADAGGQSPRRKLSRSPTSGQGGAGVEEPVYAAGEEPAGHMSNDGDGWSIGGHGEMEGDASEGEGDRGRAVGSGEGLSEEAAVAAALQAQKELKEARAAGGGLARSRSSSRNFQPSEPAQAEWVCMGQNGVDLTWREEVIPILEDFTERTPGSVLEAQECCLTWHYRDTDEDFGIAQAKSLQLHFDEILQYRSVRVVTRQTNKNITLQPLRINKGRALLELLKQDYGGLSDGSAGGPENHDFILVMGDEKTDEDMFTVLNGSRTMMHREFARHFRWQVPRLADGSHLFTVTVGRKTSKAQYFVEDSDVVLGTLQALGRIATGAASDETSSTISGHRTSIK